MNKNEEKQTLSFENLWDMYESFRDEKNKLSDFALNFATKTTALYATVATFLGGVIFLSGVKFLFDLYKDEPPKLYDSVVLLICFVLPLVFVLIYSWAKLVDPLNDLHKKIKNCENKKKKISLILVAKYPAQLLFIDEEIEVSDSDNYFIQVANSFRTYIITVLGSMILILIFTLIYLKLTS